MHRRKSKSALRRASSWLKWGASPDGSGQSSASSHGRSSGLDFRFWRVFMPVIIRLAFARRKCRSRARLASSTACATPSTVHRPRYSVPLRHPSTCRGAASVFRFRETRVEHQQWIGLNQNNSYKRRRSFQLVSYLRAGSYGWKQIFAQTEEVGSFGSEKPANFFQMSSSNSTRIANE